MKILSVKLLMITSIFIVILFSGVSFCKANFFFNRKVKKEIETMFSQNYQEETEIVSEDDLKDVPQSVQKWLKAAGVVGQEEISAVRLKQIGKMRNSPGGNWMSAQAEQYFTIDEPEFIWKVKVKMAPFLNLIGRDKYKNGKGNMLIKLLGLITVADGTGKEIDQGTLLRYLGEMVWFPTAALSDYIEWEAIDSNSAQATMSYGDITASAIFKFNEQGDVINFSCRRYYSSDKGPRLEKYKIPLWAHKEFEGIRIPTKGEAIWELEEGDYKYYKLEVTEIEYNKPVVY